jgi:hypothetical protein
MQQIEQISIEIENMSKSKSELEESLSDAIAAVGIHVGSRDECKAMVW